MDKPKPELEPEFKVMLISSDPLWNKDNSNKAVWERAKVTEYESIWNKQ